MTEKAQQPTSFYLTPENQEKARQIIAQYPAGKQASAILPLLHLAQKQAGGWLPRAAMDHVAELLGLAPIRAYEVATFYTMFNLEPVGKYLIQLCRSTPCWLRGADQISALCQEKLGIKPGQTTPDGLFSLVEVECLGACACAPVAQINDDYYEDLTPENFAHVLDELAAGRRPTPGPQSGRKGACPQTCQACAEGKGKDGSAC